MMRPFSVTCLSFTASSRCRFFRKTQLPAFIVASEPYAFFSLFRRMAFFLVICFIGKSNLMPDFRSFALNSPSELEVFIKFDSPRFVEFTGMLNARLDALPTGGTLLVTDCTSLQRQYNLVVKWFCWRAFLSKHTFSKMDKKERRKAVVYEMLPDYSGIKKINVHLL